MGIRGDVDIFVVVVDDRRTFVFGGRQSVTLGKELLTVTFATCSERRANGG